MKKILTANIETPVRQPFTRYSLEHLQQAYSELILDLSNAPSLTKDAYFSGHAQILSGCAPAQTVFGFWIIPAGLIKYNSELYHVPATAVHITPPNVPVCYIYESYISQDPLELTDGSLEYVHQIKNIIITGGISGSGGLIESGYTYLCDYSELLSTPTITDAYPTAVVQSDIQGMAHTGQTINTNITITGTTVYTPTTVTNSSINQFDEFTYDSIYEITGTVFINSGWRLLGVIPQNALPKDISVDYYTTCILYEDSQNVTVQPLKIQPDGNMYYYKPVTGGTPSIHVHLKYNV